MNLRRNQAVAVIILCANGLAGCTAGRSFGPSVGFVRPGGSANSASSARVAALQAYGDVLLDQWDARERARDATRAERLEAALVPLRGSIAATGKRVAAVEKDLMTAPEVEIAVDGLDRKVASLGGKLSGIPGTVYDFVVARDALAQRHLRDAMAGPNAFRDRALAEANDRIEALEQLAEEEAVARAECKEHVARAIADVRKELMQELDGPGRDGGVSGGPRTPVTTLPEELADATMAGFVPLERHTWLLLLVILVVLAANTVLALRPRLRVASGNAGRNGAAVGRRAPGAKQLPEESPEESLPSGD